MKEKHCFSHLSVGIKDHRSRTSVLLVALVAPRCWLSHWPWHLVHVANLLRHCGLRGVPAGLFARHTSQSTIINLDFLFTICSNKIFFLSFNHSFTTTKTTLVAVKRNRSIVFATIFVKKAQQPLENVRIKEL